MIWQRVPVWKISFIVVVLLFSLWKLIPTIEFYSYDSFVRNSGETEEMRQIETEIENNPSNAATLRNQYLALKQDFRAIQNNSIRLGLDLQGGVHMVITVDMERFEQDLINQGKDETEIQYAKDTVLDSAAAVIQNRVDQYGVSEAALIKQPPDRLVLEIPGFSDPEQVRELVRADAQLYFHLVAEKSEIVDVIADIDAVVEDDLTGMLYDTSMGAVVIEDPDNYDVVKTILERPQLRGIVPSNRIFRWGNVEEPNRFYDFPHRFLYLLKATEELTGSSLTDAYVFFNPVDNQPEVSISFDREGTRTFRRVTGNNVGKNLAIVMDDTVFSAPVIQGEIPSGNATINGIGTYDEARQTSVILRAGSLPAPLEIAESRVVGPSLGQDSIQASMYAGMIGAGVVLVFMIVYYMGTGLVANVAVLLNLFLLITGLALFKATLTLPGIAGIVLTIGMAVDANVLIFERLREELAGKRHKTVQLVLERGYGRAFMTIFDANLTTLITALVLFQFGTGPIKGFAVTLSLGILISMFTAVFVSRVILDTMTGFGMKNLSVGTLRFFNTPKIDFLTNAKPILMGSTALGLAGSIFLVANWANLKGIDFAGGDEVILQYEQSIEAQEIRDGLTSVGLVDTVIQRVLGQDNQMLIRVRDGSVTDINDLLGKLKEAVPNNTFQEPPVAYGHVNAKVGGELLMKGLYCLFFSSIGILLYITARFEFRFAVASVAALFHDLFFTLGILAVTGTEFNLPIIAALLTVLGYSLNDTIVVFDRIRENHGSTAMNFKEVVNKSINETLTRTVNTSLTTLFVVITLFIMGGSVIHDFAFTLMIGIVIGTYSSIFVASPILLLMGEPQPEERHDKAQSGELNTAS